MADGREVERFEIVEVHDFYGNIYQGEEALDHLQNADEVFYRIDIGGEEHFRWIGGPFDSLEDVEAVAEDAEDHYSSVS